MKLRSPCDALACNSHIDENRAPKRDFFAPVSALISKKVAVPTLKSSYCTQNFRQSTELRQKGRNSFTAMVLVRPPFSTPEISSRDFSFRQLFVSRHFFAGTIASKQFVAGLFFVAPPWLGNYVEVTDSRSRKPPVGVPGGAALRPPERSLKSIF